MVDRELSRADLALGVEFSRRNILVIREMYRYIQRGQSDRAWQALTAAWGAYSNAMTRIVERYVPAGDSVTTEAETLAQGTLDAYFRCGGDWTEMVRYWQEKEAHYISRLAARPAEAP